ncbi:hypothetical protein, partial [Desulfofustis glycolicus]
MKKIISTTTAFLFVASLGIAGTAAAASWNFKEDYLDRSVTTVSDSKKAAPEQSMAAASSRGSDEQHVVSWNFDEGNFTSGAEVIESGPAADRLAASGSGDDVRLVSWNSDEGRFD